MYGYADWNDENDENDYLLPPDVAEFKSGNVWEYPIFFDKAQGEHIDGMERLDLMNKGVDKGPQKWDFFYRYDRAEMERLKQQRIRILDNDHQVYRLSKEQLISGEKTTIRNLNNQKKQYLKSKITTIVVSIIVAIASLILSQSVNEICFVFAGIAGLVCLITIIVLSTGAPKFDKKIAACKRRIEGYERSIENHFHQFRDEVGRIENLIKNKLERTIFNNPIPPEDDMLDWHYGNLNTGEVGNLQKIEVKAIKELQVIPGEVVKRSIENHRRDPSFEDLRHNPQAIILPDLGSKAFPGFQTLFIDGPGWLQNKQESGYRLFEDKMETFYTGSDCKQIHFRVTYNQFIAPTKHKVCSYRFFYDRIQDKIRGIRTEEYFFEDVVMITTAYETRDFHSEKEMEEFFTFIMTLKSGNSIQVSLAGNELLEFMERLYNKRFGEKGLDGRQRREAELIVKHIRKEMSGIKRISGDRNRGR